ncbi:von Willebrand factor A domain-containing protein 8 [Leucoagaricus sp. SymC.cos]|nr:von Willebrand factor A domain-containing protein 8 [Leucoagaricus sp. SymC.cos]
MGLLTSFMQAHVFGWDVSLIPPVILPLASTFMLTLVRVFSGLLGYDSEMLHMYKELGGRELLMRRKIEDGGATSWEPSPLVEAPWSGWLLHLLGLNVIRSTIGSLLQMFQDREAKLWEGKHIVGYASPDEIQAGKLLAAHPSFCIISTTSKSLPLKDWLSDKQANMFFPIPSRPMDAQEELSIFTAIGHPKELADTLLQFTEKYRASISANNILRSQRLETLDLSFIISQSLLSQFLPAIERLNLNTLLKESNICMKADAVYSRKLSPHKQMFIILLHQFNPSPRIEGDNIIYPPPSSSGEQTYPTIIPSFKPSEDLAGISSHVPYHFYNNSLQTGLMCDLAIDLELLGKHVVLLGNQGVGKNKIVDRLCQDMPNIDALFTTLEEYDKMNVKCLKYTKINLVVRRIADLVMTKSHGTMRASFENVRMRYGGNGKLCWMPTSRALPRKQ